MKKSDLFALLAIAALTAWHGGAFANTTICDEKDVKKYGYGQKASVDFVVPNYDFESFTNTLVEYTNVKHLTYAATEYEDVSIPNYKNKTHYLENPPAGVAIKLVTYSLSNKVWASLSTYSYKCGATADWQPYWRDFTSFIKSNGYQIQK